MATISPEKVIDSSAYVQDALTVSKRLALMALAAKWRRVDPADVRGTMEPLLPEIEQLMHEQQALGRQIGWTQGGLAAAVATGEAPGSIPLPLDAARDGRLRGGPPFANALQRAIPGALARISSGVRPDAAVADAGRMVALQLGSIAHDEARLVTQDLVMAQGGGAVPRMGYARKAEGARDASRLPPMAVARPSDTLRPRPDWPADSLSAVSAPEYSPPTEKPCMRRMSVSRIGARMPMSSYVGRIVVMASGMSMRVVDRTSA